MTATATRQTELAPRILARIHTALLLRGEQYTDEIIAIRLGVSRRTVERDFALARKHNIRPTRQTARWESRAACKNVDPDTFFLAWYHTHRPDVQAAKAICASCPVLDQCRDYALIHPRWTSDGIWAGMTPSERRKATGSYRYERRAA
ncbi:WhiB family transcriptional regulator [Nonomuraea sp. NPDC049646]|uniref:WhiB family transcriptional regulator n=1 Tax=unclassified Nonomuraea TaxID=2593643 RepID=UPI0037BCE7A5